MRKVMAVVVSCVLLAACGSSHSKQEAKTLEKSPQTKQAEAQAKKVYEQCKTKGGGWKAEVRCAIPPGHGVAFLRCVLDHKPANLHNQAADEADIVQCGEKYR